MKSDLLRGLFGLVSILAGVAWRGVAWAAPALLSGGYMVSEMFVPNAAILLMILSGVLFLISVTFMGLFAAGIYSSRFGPERRGLWILCIFLAAGTAALFALVLHLTGRSKADHLLRSACMQNSASSLHIQVSKVDDALIDRSMPNPATKLRIWPKTISVLSADSGTAEWLTLVRTRRFSREH